MVVFIIALILLFAFLPQILKAVQGTLQKDADQEQADKESELKRQDKGAVENTVDFIFGEDTAKNIQKNFEDFLGEKNPEDQTIKDLEKSATETFDTQVKFDPSTKVSSTGIITADSPPSADLSKFLTTEQEIFTLSKTAKRPKSVFIS